MVIIIIHAPLTQLLLTPFQRKDGYKINVGWLARWKKGTKMLGFISQIFIYMLFMPPFIRSIVKASISRQTSKHQYTPLDCFSINEEGYTAKECRANRHMKDQLE